MSPPSLVDYMSQSSSASADQSQIRAAGGSILQRFATRLRDKFAPPDEWSENRTAGCDACSRYPPMRPPVTVLLRGLLALRLVQILPNCGACFPSGPCPFRPPPQCYGPPQMQMQKHADLAFVRFGAERRGTLHAAPPRKAEFEGDRRSVDVVDLRAGARQSSSGVNFAAL